MQKEELSFQKNSYAFEFAGGNNNIYLFETASGIQYEVQFKPSPYIFDKAELFASFIYEFVLLVRENANPIIESDKRVPFTIVHIILDFYKNNDNNVCIYICDSSDGKQLARARKFNYWFSYFNEGGFIQMTEVFKDRDGTIYPIGMILKVKNAFRAQIVEAFANLVSEYDKE
jgi:hypothetical protein